MTVTVWLLILFWDGTNRNGGPLVIDNIATQRECVEMSRKIIKPANKHYSKITNAQCLKVTKVKT